MGEIDFVVLKINGVSVQHFSEDEAVQTFLKTNDPIQIEVQQLQTTLNSTSNSYNTNSENALVLTLRCLTISSVKCLRNTQTKETQTSDFINDFNGQKNNCERTSTVVTNNEQLIEEEHVIFDQCLAPEIDIEEVTLRKSNSNEFLGLSIIYSGADSGSKTDSGGSNKDCGSASENNNDSCTEIYINHIQKNSVAGRDGRLRQGDQILQINGKDIKTKEETETLIAENNNAVTLLVSRYVFTDEDDFNDPSLIVDLEVDDAGDENDETDEEDVLYVDNNSVYENCLTANDNGSQVKNLAKLFDSQEKNRDAKSQPVETIEVTAMKKLIGESNDDNTLKMPTVEKSKEYRSYQKENLNAELKSRNKNSALCAQEQLKNVQVTNSKKSFNDIDLSYIVDSDSEHIYETIPEDSEAEPFYCSPYESSTYVNAVDTCSSSNSTNVGFHLQQRQNQRVAQWLGLCSAPTNTTLFPRKTIPMRNRNLTAPKEPAIGRCANNTDTVHSIVTIAMNGSGSAGGGGVDKVFNNHQEEQDNSSSAYNTGGSNASANQTSNEPIFFTKTPQEEALSTPLANRVIKKLQLSKEKEKINSKTAIIGTSGLTKANCSTRTGCDELSVPDTLVRMYPPMLMSQTVESKHSNKESSPLNYNKSHLTQAEVLPRAVSMICPHFTAPNLHQYHFVSSQEVSVVHPGTITNDTSNKIQLEPDQIQQNQQPSMVWKVKRRPDGTRYIVRRPAVTVMRGTEPTMTFENRGRGQRNFGHNNNRNDPTTTEDDTISEVKTGRYWSKEDRKKHVERAREKRLQQQQQQHIGQQIPEGSMCISEKMIARLQQHRKNRQKYQMLKIQHQDLQFGGSLKIMSSHIKSVNAISSGISCDPQSVVGIKHPASAKSNLSSQQHQNVLIPNENIAGNAIKANENDHSENCSSP